MAEKRKRAGGSKDKRRKGAKGEETATAVDRESEDSEAPPQAAESTSEEIETEDQLDERARRKMHPMLQTAVDHLAGEHPQFPLKIVVVPASLKNVEPLIEAITKCSGEPTQIRAEAVSCEVPAAQVWCLAASPWVSYMRLARMHTMH